MKKILFAFLLIAGFAGSALPSMAQEIRTPGAACSVADAAFWEQSSICNTASGQWQRPAFQLGSAITACDAASKAGLLQWTGTGLQLCGGASGWATLAGPNGVNALLGTATGSTNPQRSGDATTGLVSLAASTVGIVTAGVEALRVTATGSVGIGTTAPAYKLDVVGKLHVSDNAGLFRMEGTDHAYLEFYKNGPTTRDAYIGFGWAGATNLNILTQNDGTDIILLPNGNVGIGTATPTNKLHVEGTGGGSAGIYLNSAVPSATSYTLYNDAGTLSWAGTASFSGYVGIGGPPQDTTLSIRNVNESGTITHFTQALTRSGLNFIIDYTASAYTPGVFWSTANENPSKPKAGIWLQETPTGTKMLFGTSNSYATGITNQVIMDQSGNVVIYGNAGIGSVITPTNKLHVQGVAGGSAGIYLNSAVPSATSYTLYNDAGVLKWNGAEIGASASVALGTATGSTNPQRSGDATTGLVSLAASTVGVVTAGVEALRVTATGSVGIGTADPSTPLVVQSNGTTVSVKLQNSSAAGYPGINIINDTGTLVSTFVHSNPSAGTLPASTWIGTRIAESLHFITGGVAPRMTIDSTGNVGIGTTAPAQKLDVAGVIRASSEIISTTPNGFRIAYGSYGAFFRNDGTNTYLLLTASGDPYGTWNTLRPFTVSNSTGAVTISNALYVTATGSVGIGDSSPAALLTVGSGDLFQVDSSGNTTVNGVLTVTPSSLISTIQTNSSDSRMTFITNRATDTHLAYLFQVNGGAIGALAITDVGNVGIGVTAPVNKLDVTSANSQIRFGSTAADSGGYLVSTSPGQAVLAGGANFNGTAWVAKTTGASLLEASGGAYAFYGNTGLTAGNTYTATQLMIITSTGNVGIGTTTPSAKLDLGTSGVVQTYSSGGSGAGGSTNTAGFRTAWASGYGASFEAWDGSVPRWGIYKWNATTPAVVMQGVYNTTDVSFSGTVTAPTFSGSVAYANITGIPTRTAWSGVHRNFVAEQLSWKNYGNGHTIFDASASTSPQGTAVNNTDAANAWVASYPTLMGWNGSATYGVRVDRARLADSATNADTLDGLHATQLFNNMGNNHGNPTDFNTPTDFGFRFIQGTGNGPGIAGAQQYYSLGVGLGNEYPYTSYAMQLAIPRVPLGGTPVLSVRFREGGSWGSWAAVGAGGGSTQSQTFTSSGTWTKPAGTTEVSLLVIGGGGGGGGATTSTDSCYYETNNGGAGGGGGGGRVWVPSYPVTGNLTITVGNGGNAGGLNATGGTGGSSSVVGGSYDVAAAGGSGGAYARRAVAPGGAGGLLANGSNGAGGTGGQGGVRGSGTCAAGGGGGGGSGSIAGGAAGQSGSGGATAGGTGSDAYGYGGVLRGAGGAGGNSTSAGTAGSLYGGGGGGGGSASVGVNGGVGGAGAKGVVLVIWKQ